MDFIKHPFASGFGVALGALNVLLANSYLQALGGILLIFIFAWDLYDHFNK